MRHLQHLHNVGFIFFAIIFAIIFTPCKPAYASSERIFVTIAAHENRPGMFTDTNNTVSSLWPELLNYTAQKEHSYIAPILAITINSHMKQLLADENSLYSQLLKKYFDRAVSSQNITAFPVWLKAALMLLTMILSFFIIFIFGSRFQVNRRTSELQKTNDALRQSEQHYRNLNNEIPDIRYRTDLEGQIVHVAGSVLKLTGYTVDEILGKNAADFYLDPEQRNTLTVKVEQNRYVNDFIV